MAVPVVAIVGRPNVGKSSLFNWLARRRIAIVDPTAGVTRDRMATLIPLPLGERGEGVRGERFFELIDTGGLGIQDVDNLTVDIERQIDIAIDQASLILFMVDGRDGVAPLDEQVVARLRPLCKPIILVVNKCDTEAVEPQAGDVYRLGLKPIVFVSALQNRGKDALLTLIAKNLPAGDADEAPPGQVAMKLAIVGRRNTGKSTFINQLAHSERMIVSEVPGTTRDSVDVRFEKDGKTLIAIDTAGVRRKRSLQNSIEFYSLHRAERSIRRADVALLFLDAPLKISKVDKQLADYILEQNKPAIFVVNKWDLASPLPTSKYGDYLRKIFPNLDYVPIAFITAKDGRNVQRVLDLAQSLFKQSSSRVATGDLNRVMRKALQDSAPPAKQNRRPKVFYATQVSANPPTIVLMTNDPELFSNTYRRFLLKEFRDHLPFGEVPIKLYLRSRKRGEWGEGTGAPPSGGRKPAKAGTPTRLKGKPPAKKKAKARGPELWKDL